MPPAPKIVKTTGEIVEFDPKKIGETLRRIGAKPEIVTHVVGRVADAVKDGMTTGQIFARVRRELHKEDRCLAHRYNLKSGLLKLGPAGFKFEKYIASILQAYQYDAELPEDDLAGLCVRHEVDVVATKNGHSFIIEAKFRNRFEDTVTLKDALATWSRFTDLVDGAKARREKPYDELWIMTNGRFSDRAAQYGICKGIKMIGWSSTERSFARMVDHASLYPLTVIETLRQWELERFAEKNLMLCREIADQDPKTLARRIGIPMERSRFIVDACKEMALTC